MVKDVSDIITHYDENFERDHSEGRTCEVAERTEKLSVAFLSSNSN